MTRGKMNNRQLVVLMTTCLFSPMIRLLPRLNTAAAGRGAWISVLLATIPTLLMVIFAHYVISGKNRERTLGNMFCDAYGQVGGNIVNMLMTLWLLIYSGMVIRTSSERLISTIFKQGDTMFFTIILLLLIIMVAVGRERTLAYMGQVVWYILIPVLILVTVFALVDMSVDNLMPLDISEGMSYLKGTVPVISVMSPWVYFLYFQTEGHRKMSLWGKMGRISMALGLALMVTVTTVGVISPELTEVLHDPFFSMIRTLNVFGVLERMESLVISLWVLTDVIYLGGLLSICVSNIRNILGTRSIRWTAVFAAGAVMASSVLVAESASELSVASDVVIPVVNMAVTYGVIPISALISHRKRSSVQPMLNGRGPAENPAIAE